jgi:superfamily I DNA/RNA helicase
MEMNNRIQTILPNKLPYYVGSLHGLSYRLLQEFAKINSIVLNENESKYLIKQSANKILKDANFLIDEENMIRLQIPYIYDKISTTYPVNITDVLNKLSISTKYKKIINDILKEYKLIKKAQNLLDFNDLMIQICFILDKNKLTQFLKGINYVFFDEYQDINPIQFYILKSFKYSHIMAVGDDAQAIYSFRGSNVKYIWDFNKDFDFNSNKIYYLETNYRSTNNIVNLFQDTISHNTKQYTKSVISNSVGLKPHIKCHNSSSEQYIWVVEDIIQKQKEGVQLKDMVILTRTNSSIEKIELELIKNSIPIIKSIGISLLNKNHIKDFIAFLILINNNSTIHLQRVLACHKHIGIIKANEIIENNQLNCLQIIEKYKDELLLNELYEILNSINKKKTKEQVHTILQYLIKIWKDNKERNTEMIQDINSIILYMRNDTIEQFINNLHLNIEIEHTNDSLFISTIHSAKGLEWDHVYIIDVTCKDFPSIKPGFYTDTLDISEEERRLFYVACSRAKTRLTITTYIDIQNNISISPFIKELDSSNYIGSGIKTALSYNYAFTGYILKDCINYLRYNGYEKIIPFMNIQHTRIQNKMDINAPITLDRDIANSMMELLVYKMLQNNFSNIKGFGNKLNMLDKLPDTIYYNYIDRLSSWRNILKDIYYIASHRHHNIDSINTWKEFFLSINTMKYYNHLEKILVDYIKVSSKTTDYSFNININYNCNKDPIKGSIDILIEGSQNILIELKLTPDDACTVSNISQLILYGYLLKKTILLDNAIIFNLWDGTMDLINMKSIELSKFKKIIYS